jgi:hypothetical protein
MIALLLTVCLALPTVDPWFLDFCSSPAFANILSRYSPADDRDSRVILMILSHLAGRSVEVARVLLENGVDRFLARNYGQMESPQQRNFAVVTIFNLLVLVPQAQEAFLRSELMDRLIAGIEDEAYRVKKVILLLLCAISRGIEEYARIFLTHGVMAAYLNGLELGSKRVEMAVVESLLRMLEFAVVNGNDQMKSELLEAYEEANITEIMEERRDNSESEVLVKKIVALEEWMRR